MSQAPEDATATPDRWRDQLDDRFSLDEPERQVPPGGVSAVMTLLVDVDPEPLVLYTRRSEHLSAHPGEISFPGGRTEANDDGPLETALRETEEEVGVPPSEVDVLGHFTDFHTFHDILICGYVGVVQPDVPRADPTTPHEVAEQMLVPLSGLIDGKGQANPDAREAVLDVDAPLGRVYPVRAYEGRQLPPDERGGATLHYWRLADQTTIWGITGELTARFLSAAFDWTPPRSPDPVHDRRELEP